MPISIPEKKHINSESVDTRSKGFNAAAQILQIKIGNEKGAG